MTEKNPPKLLRRLLEGPGIVQMPGLHDCLMAKLVESVGFSAAFMGDGAVSVSRLGLPDFGYVDRGEVVDRTREVCKSLSLPLIVDIGTGYGNALNLQRTIAEIEAAGASGAFFEDQTSPKKCGHIRGRSLVSTEEMCMKVRAAVDIRKDDDFVLVARTDALAVEGFDSAIKRINAYAEAGADVVFIDALETVEQIQRAPREASKPMMVNILEGGKTPYLSAAELEQLGYKMVIWPETLMYAGFSAMQRVATELKQNGVVSGKTREHMTDFTTMSNFLGLEQLYEREKRYQDT